MGPDISACVTSRDKEFCVDSAQCGDRIASDMEQDAAPSLAPAQKTSNPRQSVPSARNTIPLAKLSEISDSNVATASSVAESTR